MTPKKKKAQPPAFEEALEQLEEIVARLEDGTLGLDDSITEFERGMQLLKACHTRLEQAEQKIEVLTRVDVDGSEVTQPLAGTSAKSAPEKGSNDSDTSSLF